MLATPDKDRLFLIGMVGVAIIVACAIAVGQQQRKERFGDTSPFVSDTSPFVKRYTGGKRTYGLVYKPKNEDVLAVMRKIGALTETVQQMACAELRKHMHDINLALFDAIAKDPELANVPCSMIGKAVPFVVDALQQQVPSLSDELAMQLKTRLADVWDEVNRLTCTDDKVDAQKAVKLADDIIDSLC